MIRRFWPGAILTNGSSNGKYADSHVSRELHDGFAQLGAYLLVRIDTVEALVGAQRPDEALSELERLRSVTDDLYQDVRESISELRTRVSERGLPATIREYVDAYEDRHDLTVHIDGHAAAESLPPLIAFQLLRIVQEALANVRKHANARDAWISFTKQSADRLQVVIADDGRGFDPHRADRGVTQVVWPGEYARANGLVGRRVGVRNSSGWRNPHRGSSPIEGGCGRNQE